MFFHNNYWLTVAAVIWPRYCRQGVKPFQINQTSLYKILMKLILWILFYKLSEIFSSGTQPNLLTDGITIIGSDWAPATREEIEKEIKFTCFVLRSWDDNNYFNKFHVIMVSYLSVIPI